MAEPKPSGGVLKSLQPYVCGGLSAMLASASVSAYFAASPPQGLGAVIVPSSPTSCVFHAAREHALL